MKKRNLLPHVAKVDICATAYQAIDDKIMAPLGGLKQCSLAEHPHGVRRVPEFQKPLNHLSIPLKRSIDERRRPARHFIERSILMEYVDSLGISIHRGVLWDTDFDLYYPPRSPKTAHGHFA
jgi:hypothetical protein